MNLGFRQPILGKDVFVASNAVVVGDVQLGNQSSVYMGAVLRGNAMFFSTLKQVITSVVSATLKKHCLFDINNPFNHTQVIAVKLALVTRPTSRTAL